MATPKPLFILVLAAVLSSTVHAAPTHVIVDSDGAVFWDDGAALALLLEHPDKVRVQAVTTVLGNHWPLQAAEYLARVLKAGGKEDIPIHVGAADPLVNSRESMEALERELIESKAVPAGGFWRGAYSRPRVVRDARDVQPAAGEERTGVAPRPQPADEHLVQALRGASEPVTVVAIGPLTNVARALAADPTIAANIRQLLVMGGAVRVAGNSTPHAELNFLFDPEAAKAVLRSDIGSIVLFPLDLTAQAVLTGPRYRELAAGDKPYAALLRADRGPKFADQNYSVPAWDATVAAYLVDPGYVTRFENIALDVETGRGARYGAVRGGGKEARVVRVALEMDAERFFRVLKSAFVSASSPQRVR